MESRRNHLAIVLQTTERGAKCKEFQSKYGTSFTARQATLRLSQSLFIRFRLAVLKVAMKQCNSTNNTISRALSERNSVEAKSTNGYEPTAATGAQPGSFSTRSWIVAACYRFPIETPLIIPRTLHVPPSVRPRSTWSPRGAACGVHAALDRTARSSPPIGYNTGRIASTHN